MTPEPQTVSFSGQIGADRIETPRLILRPPVYSDGLRLYALLSDPIVCRYSPYPPIASIADAYFWLSSNGAKAAQRGSAPV